MRSVFQKIPAYHSTIVLKAVCIAWFITKLICYKLWLADRLFPLIPVNKAFSAWPPLLHSTLFVVSMVCMLIILFYPLKKITLVLIVAELLSCVLDQNRWQPWEYQFIFMLAVIAFNKEDKKMVHILQMIIAGLYFFSGLSKLNSAFIHDIWQHLVLRRWLHIGPMGIWVIRAGYLLPLIEMSAGIGLLIKRTRKPAMYALCLMHFLILVMLGPFGLNINAVIWPWNLLMPFLLVYLFHKMPFSFANGLLSKPFAWLVLLCWWILPWLQLWGYWDRYLSSVLYSGGVTQLFICSGNAEATKQMAAYLEKDFKSIPCRPLISVYKWGIAEMKTAPYPESRIYNAIIASWKERYPNSSDRFYLYKPGFVPVIVRVGQ